MPWKLKYNPLLRLLARELRQKGTLAEVLLWQCLRRGQRGYDFHRQRPIDEYIVDFFSAELMLAIEIDGESHALKGDADEKRQRRLEGLGVSFLRFDDALVKTHRDDVARVIDDWIAAHERVR